MPEATLRRGSSGPEVRRLQDLLVAAGFDPGGSDGVFGARTEAAVRSFQGAKGLVVDGVVGPRTWAALQAGVVPVPDTNGSGRSRSIHIGLNFVDPAHYGGWDGELAACEFDAHDMDAIAKSRGFDSQVLLTADASADAVISAITDAAAALSSGDALFLTYSGHGGQVPDTSGDETDRMDETWCLYDRELIDDELYALWAQFQPAVRISVLSDSCHSGSVTRARVYREQGLVPESVATRNMPKDVESQTYALHKDLYDGLQHAVPRSIREQIASTVLLMSGCADNQLSSDGARNGLFTAKLREVWDDGNFTGSWREFYQRISLTMPPSQSPNYYRVGTLDESFDRQTPFTP